MFSSWASGEFNALRGLYVWTYAILLGFAGTADFWRDASIPRGCSLKFIQAPLIFHFLYHTRSSFHCLQVIFQEAFIYLFTFSIYFVHFIFLEFILQASYDKTNFFQKNLKTIALSQKTTDYQSMWFGLTYSIYKCTLCTWNT